ncbi:MAG: ribosome maturation factor RimM, partial [Candidatus Nanopelagicales bacterium]
AEALTGTLLEVDRDADERPEDPEEFYDDQLVGLVVIADGAAIGEVAEVIHLPAQDLLAVQHVDGREVLVPFVAEIVPTVDLDGHRIIVDPPPGLLDPDEQ